MPCEGGRISKRLLCGFEEGVEPKASDLHPQKIPVPQTQGVSGLEGTTAGMGIGEWTC